MIEDFIMKYALNDTANIYLMKLVPSLLHTGFVSTSVQQVITKSLEEFIMNNQETEERKEISAFDDNFNEDQLQKNKFSAGDVAFLRDHCIKAIKAKPVKAEESNKMTVVFKQEEAKQDEEADDKENKENMMEVDRVVKSSEDSQNIMIDTTKSMDSMIIGMGKKRKKPFQEDVQMAEEGKVDVSGRKQGGKVRKDRWVKWSDNCDIT